MSDPVDYLRSIANDDALAHAALRHYDTGHMTRDDMLSAFIRLQQKALRAHIAEGERLRMNLPITLHVPVCGHCGEPALAPPPVPQIQHPPASADSQQHGDEGEDV